MSSCVPETQKEFVEALRLLRELYAAVYACECKAMFGTLVDAAAFLKRHEPGAVSVTEANQ